MLTNRSAELTAQSLQGLKSAVIEGHDIGGTCVNRGCVPSKALLAASGRVRELQNSMHLKAMGIQVSSLGLPARLSFHERSARQADEGL